MGFDAQSFIADVNDENKTTLDDFKSDPQTTLEQYGLTIDNDQAEVIKDLNQLMSHFTDLSLIAAPIEPEP